MKDNERGSIVSRRPLVTYIVAVVTTVVSIAALFDSSLMDLLVRDRPLLESGQWWRAVTPLLVQPDGWGQLAFNLLGVMVVGGAAERRIGRSLWLVSYFGGGLASVAIYSAWHPADTGGGSSAAVAALIGSLVVATVARPDESRLGGCAQVYAVFFAVYLTTLDLGSVAIAALAGNISIAVTVTARRAVGVAHTAPLALTTVAVAACVMTSVRDDHGTGLLFGLLCGSLMELRLAVARRPTRIRIK